MEPLSSYRMDPAFEGKDAQEAASAADARQRDGATREEVCTALSELRLLQPSRSHAPGAIGSASEAAIAGESAPMQRLRSQIKRIAPYFRTALIIGVPGSGKEGVARMLHALSPSGQGEFIAHDASILADAFSRDQRTPPIDAILANPAGATLYLNEVGEVPLALQGDLLRLFTTIGRARLRLIAGTHRDLHTMGVTGQFRPDLVQRLMGIELCLPPLRDRREDLPTVFSEVLRSIAGDRDLRLSDEANARLLAHSWANDLAEVDHVLRHAANSAGRRSRIESSNLPELPAEEAAVTEEVRMQKLQDVVHQHVLGVLTRCGGNKLRAAEILGISRSTLYRMLETCVGEGFVVG